MNFWTDSENAQDFKEYPPCEMTDSRVNQVILAIQKCIKSKSLHGHLCLCFYVVSQSLRAVSSGPGVTSSRDRKRRRGAPPHPPSPPLTR